MGAEHLSGCCFADCAGCGPVYAAHVTQAKADARTTLLAVLADGERHLINESILYRLGSDALDAALEDLEREGVVALAYRAGCTRVRLASAGAP